MSGLQPETSQFLDHAMDAARRAANESGWSDEGQIEFVRMRINGAYAQARRLEYSETWTGRFVEAFASMREDASY